MNAGISLKYAVTLSNVVGLSVKNFVYIFAHCIKNITKEKVP